MNLTQVPLTRQDLRLGSGLVLFVYVAAHLTNHALGLISVDAAEHGLHVAVAVWHSLPGTVLLYGAAGIHITLALVALYERRTLRIRDSYAHKFSGRDVAVHVDFIVGARSSEVVLFDENILSGAHRRGWFGSSRAPCASLSNGRGKARSRPALALEPR